MTTKEKIIEQSLLLFAEKGYDGVSVREIARAVGVRESALYKHYKNKEDIFNQVIEESKRRITAAYTDNHVPEAINKKNIAEGYKKLSVDDLCTIAWNLFCLYTKDPIVSNFRKLLMRERFRNPGLLEQYNAFFLEGVIEHQGRTFNELVTENVFRDVDSKIIALHFYGPIYLLFQLYDCKPEEEDRIKEMLFSHVKTFGENYGKTK